MEVLAATQRLAHAAAGGKAMSDEDNKKLELQIAINLQK